MLRALATSCEHNACPTVWETDANPDVVLVQGYRFNDEATLRDIQMSNDETLAVIPRSLMEAAAANV